MRGLWIAAAVLSVAALSAYSQDNKAKDNTPPPGFKALFNGKDLTNWQGLMMVDEPVEAGKKKTRRLPGWLLKLSDGDRAIRQIEANEKVLPHWTVKDGVLEYDGKGESLQTINHFANFELYVDWKIKANGDSGIYLRGTPQVQIWSVDDKANKKKVGSGGFYNNSKNPSDPLVVADNPVGSWNTFHIKMIGDKATIHLNGKLIVDNTPLDPYKAWGADKPLPASGPIELQNHGDHLWFKNIYVKDLPSTN
jgi:hypothetical protein